MLVGRKRTENRATQWCELAITFAAHKCFSVMLAIFQNDKDTALFQQVTNLYAIECYWLLAAVSGSAETIATVIKHFNLKIRVEQPLLYKVKKIAMTFSSSYEWLVFEYCLCYRDEIKQSVAPCSLFSTPEFLKVQERAPKSVLLRR